MRRGFLGGNGTWLAVGMGAWGLKKVHQMAQRNTEILIREELKPGQRIVIANDRATIEEAEVQQLQLSEPKLKTKKKRKGAIEAGQGD